MQTFQGLSVAPGYAAGTALVYDAVPVFAIDRTPIPAEEVEQEVERFEVALQASAQELEHLRDRVLADIGQAESSIFEAHLALLSDDVFIRGVKKRIAEDHMHADHAVEAELAHLKHLLEHTGSAYLSERTHDLDDLGRRLQKHLSRMEDGADALLSALPPQTILVAHQLFPSDTLNLDRAHVAGIITEVGGAQSHAAILARSLAIPAVTGVQDVTAHINTGDPLLLDATAGTVTRTPTRARERAFSRALHSYEQSVLEASRVPHNTCTTRCGTAVELYANVGRVEETALVPTQGFDGVGLFRTEYLFLNASRAPGLDEQALAYGQAVQALGGLPLTLRTIDFGGDKHPMFLRQRVGENPNLGLRGLHFALAHCDLFETQLRAALRATRHGTLKLLFPMVVDAGDLAQAIDLVHHVAEEEQVEAMPELGAMIETPAAVFQIDRVVSLVDFVSIGTNDLTQFILVADRDSTQMMAQYSAFHPAVLSAVHRIVEAARAQGRACSICGEAAGDPRAACLFLGLGARALSMSPVLAPKVRQKISRQYLADLEEAARQALQRSSASEVEALVAHLH